MHTSRLQKISFSGLFVPAPLPRMKENCWAGNTPTYDLALIKTAAAPRWNPLAHSPCKASIGTASAGPRSLYSKPLCRWGQAVEETGDAGRPMAEPTSAPDWSCSLPCMIYPLILAVAMSSFLNERMIENALWLGLLLIKVWSQGFECWTGPSHGKYICAQHPQWQAGKEPILESMALCKQEKPFYKYPRSTEWRNDQVWEVASVRFNLSALTEMHSSSVRNDTWKPQRRQTWS